MTFDCITGIYSGSLIYEEERLITRLNRMFCSWTCCQPWLTFQRIVGLFILDAFVDLFITICILVNTGFMGADHYGMSDELKQTLENGNFVSVTQSCTFFTFHIMISLKILTSTILVQPHHVHTGFCITHVVSNGLKAIYSIETTIQCPIKFVPSKG